jgi:hypothetical protein
VKIADYEYPAAPRYIQYRGRIESGAYHIGKKIGLHLFKLRMLEEHGMPVDRYFLYAGIPRRTEQKSTNETDCPICFILNIYTIRRRIPMKDDNFKKNSRVPKTGPLSVSGLTGLTLLFSDRFLLLTRASAFTFFNLWNSLKTAKILKNNH